MNEGFGKDFYMKGNSVKRSRPFSEPSDSENRILAVLIPFPKIREEKGTPNLNFLVRIFSSGVGVFHMSGWGAKKFDMSLETREIKLFGRDIPGFCRDIPEGPEKFEKKKFVFNFRSPNNQLPLNSEAREGFKTKPS